MRPIARVLVLMLAALTLAPGATAQGPTSEQAREELRRVIDSRIRAHEERLANLRAQARALEAGADLDRIRAALRSDGADRGELNRPDAPPKRRPEGRREGTNEGRDGDRPGKPDADRRGRRSDAPPVEITPELIERAVALMRAERPEFAERLERLREENPERYRRAIERIIRELPGGDPEGARLELEVRATETTLRDLAQRVKDDPERASALKDDIRAALNATADARLAYERYRITKERDQLDRQERFLERMIEMRDDFIERRLQAILEGRDMWRGPRRDREDRGESGERETQRDRDRPRRNDRE